MKYAPIVLFVYKRLDTLINCIDSLKKNSLCANSDLFIFSDAAGKAQDFDKVEAVRSYINSLSGFKKILIVKADKNKGLADSVIAGVSQVIANYGKAIVLEDDLIVSKNFLIFMNKALDYYATEKRILSISGFTLPIHLPANYSSDIYLTKRAFSWGWATWQDRWENVDWKVSDYKYFAADRKKQSSFNQMGTDLTSMLHKQMQNQINSWAIRWCYHQYKNQLYSIFPVVSKVINDGFNMDATHSSLNNNRYKTYMGNEDQTEFVFSNDLSLNKKIIRQFIAHFSIQVRIYYKILGFFNRLQNIRK